MGVTMSDVLRKIGMAVSAVVTASVFLCSVNVNAQAFIEADIGIIKNQNSTVGSPLAERVESNQLYVQFTGAGGAYLPTQGVALMADRFIFNPWHGELMLLNDLQSHETVIYQWLPQN